VFLSLFPLRSLNQDERRLVFLLWIMGVLQGLAQAPLSSLIPYTRVGLGLSEGQMSLVLAITRVASLGAVAFSWWGDRSGRRKPFLVAYGTMLVASLLTAVATGPVWFTTAQGASRVATSTVGTLAVVLLAEGIRPGFRAFSIGLYAAAGSLGAGLGQLMLPIAALNENAWRYAFAVPVLGVAALPLLRKVEESKLVDVREAAVPLRTILTGPHSRSFWLAGTAAFCAAGFPAVALAFTTERLVNDLGYSAGAATAMALVGGTIGASGFWIGGRLADVWGRRPTTISALLASIAGGVALFEVSSVPALLTAIAVGGFGAFAYVPAAASHRAELFPTRVRATAGSAGAYLATLGSASGLAFGAAMIDRVGLTTTLLTLAAPMALAAVVTLALPETRHLTLSEEHL
jgi:MFS family permease